MADYQYLTSRGLIVPDTSTTRQQVEAEFRAVFGQDLDTDPSTPQGVLITRVTEERDAIARNNAEVANQINPDISGGVFLDALWRLTGGKRNEEVRSIITGVVLGGVPGTFIPAGSLALSTSGFRFELVSPRILDSLGGATGDFRALDSGSIGVPPHGLDSVASSVLGWETVDNPTSAIPGRVQEGDAASRRRRRQTLALQTTSVNEAIVSRLYNLPEVRSLYYLENYADTDQVVDGISMRKHSIWVCVEGGIDEDIAQVLFETKTVGGGYNGAVEVTVYDPSNGKPYLIKFDRPEEVQLLIRITIKETSLDADRLIPELVMNYVDGDLEGDISFVVGSDVSPFEVSGAINQQEPSLSVRLVEFSLVGSGVWSSSVYEIAPNQVARTQLSSISVVQV
jgi:uncharacterized phage protein gp47/JayE